MLRRPSVAKGAVILWQTIEVTLGVVLVALALRDVGAGRRKWPAHHPSPVCAHTGLSRRRPPSPPNFVHGLEEVIRVIGLPQGQTSRHGPCRDRREGGRVNHPESGIMLATAFGDLPAVELSGQLDVGDENVRDTPAAPF